MKLPGFCWVRHDWRWWDADLDEEYIPVRQKAARGVEAKSTLGRFIVSRCVHCGLVKEIG